MSTPSPVQMVQLLKGFEISQAIYVATKLGIPDELTTGPRSATDLATTLDADAAALHRLLRTLATQGIFTEVEPGHFGLTPSAEMLMTDRPGSLRDMALMLMETHYAPFGALLDTVRTGESAATRFYGKPFFDWLASDPAQVERFSRAMSNLTGGIHLAALDGYDLGDPGLVVDVGGADGALLAHILTRLPRARGIVFDLPHVVGAVERTATRSGLGERLRPASGDFFARVPSGGDLYVMSMILHDWDDDRAARILTNISKAAPGARVLSLEMVVPPGDTPHMAKMIDLTMLAMLTGRERSEAELRELFTAAGLRVEAVTHTPTPMSVVEAAIV